ncbi:MAG: site-2 protease family protein [Actinobacteria bacterium]|nr:site-2 protease family protein [Actinomycetota bacterium]
MFSNLGSEIINFLRQLVIVIPGLYLGVVLHEVAHGYIAFKSGDPTARNLGRLTLNPVAHIDIFGSILLPLILILFRTGFVFGYAKPVPINPSRFRNYRKGIRYSSLAGPVTNFLIAFILGCFLGLYIFLIKISQNPIYLELLKISEKISENVLGRESIITSGALNIFLVFFCKIINYAIFINIILGIFNFLPIPPLDGSNILATFLPGNAMYRYISIGRFGFFIIFALFYFARIPLLWATEKIYLSFIWTLNLL